MDMDLCLLSLLLFCVCRQGLTQNGEVSNDAPIPLVPLIPLMPSHPKENTQISYPPRAFLLYVLLTQHNPLFQESGTSAPSTQEPPNTSPTTPPPFVTTSAPDGGSSEEDNQQQDGGCRAQARRPKSRQALAGAIQRLGMKLLGQMKTGPEQPNVIISPLSISLALSQLALGAMNETEELLMHHLHGGSLPLHNQMSLLIVMPMNGQVNVSALAAKLNISHLYNRLPRERSMQVKLPKFKLDYSQDLQEALTNIGMGELFARPNLAAIAEGPLLVSSVQHKSSMEISEEGAEAAAATSLVILRSNPFFSLNQPFFFALMDDKTQAPVFLGVITNPNPGAPAMQSSGGSANLDKVHFPIDDKNDKHYSHSFGGPPK
ncbi:unnamed protein product, partial [Coregonus sp. 'balchen']